MFINPFIVKYHRPYIIWEIIDYFLPGVEISSNDVVGLQLTKSSSGPHLSVLRESFVSTYVWREWFSY